MKPVNRAESTIHVFIKNKPWLYKKQVTGIKLKWLKKTNDNSRGMEIKKKEIRFEL